MANAGGNYLFPVPNYTDPLDVVTDTTELAVAIDTVLGAAFDPLAALQAVSSFTTSGWSEAGFSEGVTGLAPIEGKKQGDFIVIDVNVKYNKTISIPGNGDIANFSMFTITDPAYRPRYQVFFSLYSPSNKLAVYGVVLPSGLCQWEQIHSYATSSSAVTLATGSLWRGTIRYSIATNL